MLLGCSGPIVDGPVAPSGPDAPPMQFKKSWGPGGLLLKSDSDYKNWIRILTNGRGDPDFIVSPVETASPFKDFIGFNIRLNKLDYFSGIEFRVGDSKFENYYAFPIPFYSDPQFNIIQAGEWHPYTFGMSHAIIAGSPQTAQLNYLGIYAQDNRKGPLAIDLAEIDFKPPLLEKGIVSITFKIFERIKNQMSQFKVFFIIGKFIKTAVKAENLSLSHS